MTLSSSSNCSNAPWKSWPKHEDNAAWVEVTNAHRIPDWQYDGAEEGEQGGVLINLSPSGRVEIREGLAKPELDEDTKAETADHPVAPAKPKEAYSMPLRRLIAWHKSMAVQELLLAHPRKAREVAVIDRLVNLALHEAIRNLSKQEEPGRAYASIESQARLFVGGLGCRRTVAQSCGDHTNDSSPDAPI